MRYGEFVADNFAVLLVAIPLFILLVYLLSRKYVKEDQRLRKVRGVKFIVLIMRTIFILLLLFSLANPHLERLESTGNISKINVVIDRTVSMELFDVGEIEESLDRITDVSMEINHIDTKDYSGLGNSLLNYLQPDQNTLFISDGQNNFGTKLEDVALFAASINSKIYGVNLELEERDAAISIDGPNKVVSGVENEYSVVINEVGNIGERKVLFFIDDELIKEDVAGFSVKHTFSAGTHTMKAMLEATDHFPENNVFYHTIQVYKKPKILFVSEKESAMYELLEPFYEIDFDDDIDGDLSDYYAVVLNDMQFDDEAIEKLYTYVEAGNGLFVVGGKNSYDYGKYNSSLISDILPVGIGQARKQKNIINVAILLDTGTSGANLTRDGIALFDISKAQTVEIIRQFDEKNRVAVIEANYGLSTISGLSEIGPKREQLIRDIGRLEPHLISELTYAYIRAHQMLKGVQGSKVVWIITDGNLAPYDQELTKDVVELARHDGLQTHIVGIGDNVDDNFGNVVARVGGGQFFKTDQKTRIRLFAGDPESASNTLTLVVYDQNHFITEELLDLGDVYGFNNVYPKRNAQLLLTTSDGDPILTVWNYGLGRVAALSSDDGTMWLPDILSTKNSKVVLRTINWLIEDPERKQSTIIDIPQLRLGENSEISIKTPEYPSSDLNFYEVSNSLYKAQFYPNETGFSTILDMPVAVNYKKEYLNIGIDQDMQRILAISGGSMLEHDQAVLEDNIKSLAQVETIITTDLSWIFIAAAAAVYLLEIFIRRLYDMRKY